MERSAATANHSRLDCKRAHRIPRVLEFPRCFRWNRNWRCAERPGNHALRTRSARGRHPRQSRKPKTSCPSPSIAGRSPTSNDTQQLLRLLQQLALVFLSGILIAPLQLLQNLYPCRLSHRFIHSAQGNPTFGAIRPPADIETILACKSPMA